MPAIPRRRFAIVSLALLAFLTLLAAPLAAKKAEKPGKIVGRVVTGDQPSAGVEVQVAAVEGEFRWSGKTDDKGHFEVEVAAGRYRIIVPDAASGAYESAVDVAAKEELNLEISLLDAAMAAKNEAIKTYNAGTAAYNARDEAKALELFRKSVELDGSIPQAWFGIADLELRKGDAAAAATAIDRYRAAAPDEPTGRRLALEIYVAAGRNADAAALVPGLAGDPDLKNVAVRVFNLGVESLQANETDAAAARFDLAASLDPNLAPALSALATIHYNAERYDAATAAIDRLLAVDPNSVAGRRLRFLVADGRGDLAAAKVAMTAYGQVDPTAAADLLVQRAALDFEAGDTASAKAGLEEALVLSPDHPRAHYHLGLIAVSRGDAAGAKKLLQRFLVLAPNDSEARAAREILKQL